jgi:hypothetical protein
MYFSVVKLRSLIEKILKSFWVDEGSNPFVVLNLLFYV